MALDMESSLGKPRDRKASIMSQAAKLKDWDTVWEILKERPHLVNFIPENRELGILHLATQCNNVEAVRNILSIPGCDPNLMSTNGLLANEMADDTQLKELIEIAQGGLPIPELNEVFKEEFKQVNEPFKQELKQVNGPFKQELKQVNGPFKQELKQVNGPFKQELKQVNGPFKQELKQVNGPFKQELKHFIGAFKQEFKQVNGIWKQKSKNVDKVFEPIKESFEELQKADAPTINEISSALENGDIEKATKIIDTNQHLVNVVPPKIGLAPLHQAAIKGNVDIVNKLLYYPASNPFIKTTEAEFNLHGPGKTAEELTTSEEVKEAISVKKRELTQEYYICPTFVVISDSNLILMDYAVPTIEAHKGLLCSDKFDSDKFSLFPNLLEDVFLYIDHSTKWEDAKDITSKEFYKFDNQLGNQCINQKSRESFYEKLLEVYTKQDGSVYANLNREIRNQALVKKNNNQSTSFRSYAALLNAVLFIWEDLPSYTEFTYRGMNMTDDDLKKYSAGTEFAWLNFVSSSSVKRIAERFGENKAKCNTLFIIDNKTQCKWSPKSIEKFSKYKHEKECLYPCGAQFKVTKVEIENKCTHISIELICRDSTPFRNLFSETVERTESFIKTVQTEIDQFDKDLGEIEVIVKTAAVHLFEMYINDNYETKTEKEVTKREALPKGTFTYFCLWCNTICHDACTNACGDNCKVVMPGDRCTICSTQCPRSWHLKYPYQWETVIEQRSKLDGKMKERYDTAESDFKESKAEIVKLNDSLKEREYSLTVQLEETNENVSQLKFLLENERKKYSSDAQKTFQRLVSEQSKISKRVDKAKNAFRTLLLFLDNDGYLVNTTSS